MIPRSGLVNYVERRYGKLIEEVLDDLYWERGMSCREIADLPQFDCHPSTVANYLRKSELSRNHMAQVGHAARKAGFNPAPVLQVHEGASA